MSAWTLVKPKYKVIAEGTRIRFLKSSKYEFDFKKNDKGEVRRILSPFPSASDTIYEVALEGTPDNVWVVGSDIEPWDQLSFEDRPKKYSSCGKEIMGLHCILEEDHYGKHMTSSGVTWTGNSSNRTREERKPILGNGAGFFYDG